MDTSQLQSFNKWPPLDDAGEVFFGRAIEEIGKAPMATLRQTGAINALLPRVILELREGKLSATAGGDPIPAKNWRGLLGTIMAMTCATTSAELNTGSPVQGQRDRWISITRKSLDARTGHSPPGRCDDLTATERKTLLKIIFGVAIDQFKLNPESAAALLDP